MNKPNLGAHVSTAGGLYKSIENATQIGAETIQIFGASPRAWNARVPMKDEVEKFKTVAKESAVKSVYLHASYLINLGTPEADLLTKSISNLTAHLMIAEQIGARGLIFHAGSSKGNNGGAINQAARAMTSVLETATGKAELVIENAAGGGEKIGSRPEEIGELIKLIGSHRVKSCFDTAHAFEAGLIEHYTKSEIEALLERLDKSIGLKNIVALHVNDSKTEFNSKHDRHENLGEGFIGLKGFEALAKFKELYDKAWLLEVPGFDNLGPDKKNMDILKSCFE